METMTKRIQDISQVPPKPSKHTAAKAQPHDDGTKGTLGEHPKRKKIHAPKEKGRESDSNASCIEKAALKVPEHPPIGVSEPTTTSSPAISPSTTTTLGHGVGLTDPATSAAQGGALMIVDNQTPEPPGVETTRDDIMEEDVVDQILDADMRGQGSPLLHDHILGEEDEGQDGLDNSAETEGDEDGMGEEEEGLLGHMSGFPPRSPT